MGVGAGLRYFFLKRDCVFIGLKRRKARQQGRVPEFLIQQPP